MVAIGLSPIFSTFLLGDAPTPTPVATPTPAPKPPQVSNTAPMTNAPPAVPTPLPETFNRYGKIVAIGNEPAHPLKLNLPFPNVGEVKVPNPDELNMREKLEELAALSDADIHKQLDQWPPYSKMTLKDQGALLQRIQDFRDRRSRIAQERARQMGLLTLTPEQETRFEKEYWDKRLQMDRDLAKQLQPIVRDHEQKLQEDLFREFSSPPQPGGAAQTTPPPPSPSKPMPSPSPASAQNKPSPSSAPVAAKPTPTPPAAH